MADYRKIGIIGGMGPESTALLYKDIVRRFQEDFGASKDEDFPEMIIHNLPIPDITVDIANEAAVKRMLSRSIHALEQSGAEIIGFPCNSLDYFIDHLRSQTDLPVLSIVEETCKTLKRKGVEKALLLSTPTTFERGLYHRHLSDVEIVAPQDRQKVYDVIMSTLSGQNPRQRFRRMLANDYGAHANIIIGCTDLSILVENYVDPRMTDSLSCLSHAIQEASIYGREPRAVKGR